MNLGYACLNTTLKNKSRTATVKTLTAMGKDAVPFLQKLALANLQEILSVLEWNESKGIKFFRLSSNIFPHMGNGEFKEPYFHGDIKFATDILSKIGEYARRHGHRITFHANPYIQLGTPTELVWTKSLFDIGMHYKILVMMGFVPGQYNCLIVHGGGVFDDKTKTIARIHTRLKSIPKKIRQMIVFENDEWHYTPDDLLPICEKWKLGFCFDVFHNSVHQTPVKLTKPFLKRVFATWSVMPKMHISEQDPENRKGSHSDYVKTIPPWLLKLKVDLMIEAKQKELAVLYLKRKYKI